MSDVWSDWWADNWPDIPVRPMESMDEQGEFEPDNPLQMPWVEGGGEGLLMIRGGVGLATGESDAAAAMTAAEADFEWGEWLPAGWLSRTAFRVVSVPVSELPEDGDYDPVRTISLPYRSVEQVDEDEWDALMRRTQYRVDGRKVNTQLAWVREDDSQSSLTLGPDEDWEGEPEIPWPTPDPEALAEARIDALNARCVRAA